MSQTRSNRSLLGVCVWSPPGPNAARSVQSPPYVFEILDHAGLAYERVEPGDLPARLPDLCVLVTVGEVALPEAVRTSVAEWVSGGGGWVSVAGLCGLADLVGVEPDTPAYGGWGVGLPTLGEGYLAPSASDHRIVGHVDAPLHYFGGMAVRRPPVGEVACVLDAHQRPTARAAIVESSPGSGRCVVIAPDITGSVVRIRQGIAITCDGIPSADGTAPVCDGVLKSDDGAVLDWDFDRSPVPGVPGYSAFLTPVADVWCEILVRAILHVADILGVTIPVLWLYPRNLPAVGVLSHDTDGSNPVKARALLEVVNDLGVRSTWCTILPAYDADTIAAIRTAGHEIGMHYDSMSDGCPWTEEEFDSQWTALTQVLGGRMPVTNKNHYLRWQGDLEFFAWCAARGIELDQSKGASKTGESGFNFGTCHPLFPVDRAGDLVDVLELATPTQDLIVFAPAELGMALLRSVLKAFGVLHLLFHPEHIDKPGVADALRDIVRQGAALGLEWWTAADLNNWERGRRSARWDLAPEADQGVLAAADTALEDATILLPDRGNGFVAVDGTRATVATVQRWGFAFLAATVNLEPERSIHITWG